MSEKQKENPKNKKSPKESCKQETKVDLEKLKNSIWHKVIAWENIWRIIYNHAKETGKTPIKPNRLEDVNITPGDKVYFTKDYVIVKYLKWWTKIIAFDENCDKKDIPQTKENSPKKDTSTVKKTPEKKPQTEEIKPDTQEPKIKKETSNTTEIPSQITKTQVSNSTDDNKSEEWFFDWITKKTKDLVWTIKSKISNITNFWEVEQKDWRNSVDSHDLVLWVINNQYIEERRKNIKTVFDPESPLNHDQINYKNEMNFRMVYWEIVTNLINNFCKWSIIDEEFFYWVLARESKFDENAISPTWVKWLGQITIDTFKTLVNYHETKLKTNPNMSELYVTSAVTQWNKKDKRWFYNINQKESLRGINQIKFTISYLLYLENLFKDITNKELKWDIIITAYNLWPKRTQDTIKNHKNVLNWEWLKRALEDEANKWIITPKKLKEVTTYVPSVNKYRLTWEKNKKATKLAKL